MEAEQTEQGRWGLKVLIALVIDISGSRAQL